MATANGDRNLLFGILALQMDFISRNALSYRAGGVTPEQQPRSLP